MLVIPRLGEVLDALQTRESAIGMMPLRKTAIGFAVILPIALLLTAIAAVLSKRSSKTAEAMDRLVYRLPLFGKQRLSSDIAAFCFLMNMFLETGLAIDRALSLCADCMRRGYFSNRIREAARNVAEGNSLLLSLSKIKALPGFFLSSIQKAERAGDAEEAFSRLYVYYKEEKRKRGDVLSKAAEPATTMILGLVMFGFILALVRPLLSVMGGIE